jgi:copper chaperone CopZ
MKKIQSLVAVILLALFSLSLTAQETSKVEVKEEAGFKTVKIKTTAECNMCKDRIENMLNKLDGVKTSELDVPTKIATVTYKESSIDIETIKKAIAKIGYNADDMKKNEKAYKKLPDCCKEGKHSNK